MTLNPSILLRRLYNWTLSWAENRFAGSALFLIAFVESSFFPIPPDILLIALCFGKPKGWFKYAAICTAGSVLGGILGWYIGFGLWESVGEHIINAYDPERHTWMKIENWYEAYGFWGVLVAAITPIPYKVFTIASGVLGFPLGQLIIASIIGRGFRFFIVALLIRLFGETIRPFIEKYLEWVLLAVTIAGIGGFVLLKYLH